LPESDDLRDSHAGVDTDRNDGASSRQFELLEDRLNLFGTKNFSLDLGAKTGADFELLLTKQHTSFV
jgi:hypothetical protein